MDGHDGCCPCCRPGGAHEVRPIKHTYLFVNTICDAIVNKLKGRSRMIYPRYSRKSKEIQSFPAD
ncbi:hypothetical protein OHAE_348 [Ochrobactrum soli]|uniref:Uncharacterized protein n=1 Tax=Ochrobactrum soli TaxID=2448455 RepID=A0A2P9HK06_9HYPH|nr:hypothetical protein OHAE_348 [[Ochrobactrum] soli]